MNAPVETLADLLAGLERLQVRPQGIRADSRRIRKGELFVALPGQRSDGLHHIADALARGAGAVLWESEGGEKCAEQLEGIPNLPVRGLAGLVAQLGHQLLGQPSEHLWVCGITGTNGKTSVSQWIAQALSQAAAAAA